MRSVLFLAVFMGLAAPNLGFACATTDAAFSTVQRDLTSNLNDYGRIHSDADNASCAETASGKLKFKLANALNDPTAFTGRLEGYLVALIFASAQRIGAHGYADKDLHELLRQTWERYQFAPDPNCAASEINTCMDDQAGAAAGYAWIAAYKVRRGINGFAEAAAANQRIEDFFNSVCIHNPSRFQQDRSSICNGTVAELSTGAAVTMNFNHAPNGEEGPQQIHYGFGS